MAPLPPAPDPQGLILLPPPGRLAAAVDAYLGQVALEVAAHLVGQELLLGSRSVRVPWDGVVVLLVAYDERDGRRDLSDCDRQVLDLLAAAEGRVALKELERQIPYSSATIRRSVDRLKTMGHVARASSGERGYYLTGQVAGQPQQRTLFPE